ncbi:MAG: hypothetical protein JRF64_09600, partial [Deltaproteobacteria bacterium]|nr:hypothetical protein [Deltaproteobacteria bacterium]
QYATARCRPEAEADNRVVAEGEDGYFSGTTGLPVGLHRRSQGHNWPVIFSLTPRIRSGIFLMKAWRIVWTLEGTGIWAYFLATIIIGTMDRSAHGLT